MENTKNNENGEEIDESQEILDEMMPEERKALQDLTVNLTNELMEVTQKLRMVEKELKQAVKRKKPKKDPMLGKVALVMFSRPKGEDESKIRMHVADNVDTTLALNSVKRMCADRDNEFVGAHFLLEMAGKKNSYKRLRSNAEAAWHLFQNLDRDLTNQDPKRVLEMSFHVERAKLYRDENPDIVDQLQDQAEKLTIPAKDDLKSPENWTGENWLWLYDVFPDTEEE